MAPEEVLRRFSYFGPFLSNFHLTPLISQDFMGHEIYTPYILS